MIINLEKNLVFRMMISQRKRFSLELRQSTSMAGCVTGFMMPLRRCLSLESDTTYRLDGPTATFYIFT